MSSDMVFADGHAIPVHNVHSLDFNEIQNGIVRVTTMDGHIYVARGFEAYRLIIERAPRDMEGKRLRWAKHSWAVHNLVAHPLLQILAWLGFPKLGMRIHDRTQPIPKEFD